MLLRTSFLVLCLGLSGAALAQTGSPLNPGPRVTAPAPTKPTAAPTKPAPTTPTPAVPVAQPALVDINSATREELDALPGVGEARAKKIVRKRPYSGKDDLWRRKILPRPVYEAIKDRIVAKQK